MSFRSFAGVIAAFATLLAAHVAGAQSYQSLVPLLVDLPQWQADPADGMSMQMQGQDMMWATRAYKRNDAELNVMVGTGHPMAAQADQIKQSGQTHFEMGGMVMDVRTVRTFQVMTMHNKQDKSGMVFVLLAPNNSKGAMLLVQYTNLEPADAFTLTERFDWTAMQAAAKR